ncbi:MAG: tail fiber domain-containing protein [Thiobacillus sp.]|nr:tail fiber domain-containing protein [Thiobacillus sp.]MDP2979144.1 tail fiber domain-containing protein [Thiobacillus sp.]
MKANKTNVAGCCAVALLVVLASAPAGAATEGPYNNFFGTGAGASNSGSYNANSFFGGNAGHKTTTGIANTFLGYGAGYSNTTGHDNSFFGGNAGYNTTTGYNNTFFGRSAGYNTTTGYYNTFLGNLAGYANTTGSRNVFIGYLAGYYETGSNKLYIDNCYGSCNSPFIYGEFDNHLLEINGEVGIAANGASKSQLHFSLDGSDVGGWLTSVTDNNFFVSSGAAYDALLGGWVQKSADTKAVMAGSGGVGYRVFTNAGAAVGNSFAPSVRLHIDYSGNVGINTVAVAGVPISTATGALLTAGGVWQNSSSRERKEHIEALSGAQALQALAELRPVTYNYKVDAEEKHVGFIAEDVPELLASKDRKSLSALDIVAVLTKAVQEQKQVVDEQKRTLDEKSRMVDEQKQALETLSATVAELKADVNRLKRRDAVAQR